MLERLREAETLAEKLNDERRRGQVCVFLAVVHSLLGELDEGLAAGTRALAIAGRLGDPRLRLLSLSFLTQVHYYRGEFERVVELASDNIAALSADRVYESLGSSAPISILDRVWLVVSLAQLGRFAEAAPHEAEAIRLAEPTHHAVQHQPGLLRREHAPSRRGRLGEGALRWSSSGSPWPRRGTSASIFPGRSRPRPGSWPSSASRARR